MIHRAKCPQPAICIVLRPEDPSRSSGELPSLAGRAIQPIFYAHRLSGTGATSPRRVRGPWVTSCALEATASSLRMDRRVTPSQRCVERMREGTQCAASLSLQPISGRRPTPADRPLASPSRFLGVRLTQRVTTQAKSINIHLVACTPSGASERQHGLARARTAVAAARSNSI